MRRLKAVGAKNTEEIHPGSPKSVARVVERLSYATPDPNASNSPQTLPGVGISDLFGNVSAPHGPLPIQRQLHDR